MLPTLLISSANDKEKNIEGIDEGMVYPAGSNNNDLLHIDQETNHNSIFWLLKEKLHEMKLHKMAKKFIKSKDHNKASDNPTAKPKKNKKSNAEKTTEKR